MRHIAFVTALILVAVFVQVTPAPAGTLVDIDLAIDTPIARIIGPGFADQLNEVAVGDVNDDGIGDVIIGAPNADVNGPPVRTDAGEVYVVFGGAGVAGTLDLDAGAADIVIQGAEASDSLGRAVASGDVNADGIDDIIIAAKASGDSNARPAAGEVYIIFGSTSLSGTKDILANDQDVRIIGADSGDDLGAALAVGFLTGDADGDLVIGADNADGPPGSSRPNAGEVYLIAGTSGLPAIIDLSGGLSSASAIVYGAEGGDDVGTALGVGNLNGSGPDDLAIGADDAEGPGNARAGAGEAYGLAGELVTGAVDLAGSVARLTILGAEAGDNLGTELAVADVNNDGKADVVVSADTANGPGNGRLDAGEAYVVYGRSSLSETVDIASDEQDVTIFGAGVLDGLGGAVAVGDTTGDGVADIVVSNTNGNGPPGDSRPGAGEAYLIAGSTNLPANLDIATSALFITIYGAGPQDDLGRALAIGNVAGGSGQEIVVAASKADGDPDPPTKCLDNCRANAGEVYVIGLPGADATATPTSTSASTSTPMPTTTPGSTPVVTATDTPAATATVPATPGVTATPPASSTPAATSTAPAIATPTNTLEPTPTATATSAPKVYGDANCDSTVNAVDSAFILQLQAGLISSLPCEDEADVNRDGLLNPIDSTLILQFSAGLLNNLGPSGASATSEVAQAAGVARAPLAQDSLTIDLASASPAARVIGAAIGDQLNELALGDMNGDGVRDILIGAPRANGPDARPNAGAAFVVFRGAGLPATRDLAGSPPDVTIYGSDAFDGLGRSVASGDVNGDGVDDIIVGSLGSGEGNGRPAAGEVHIIFGSSSLGGTIDTANGGEDVRIIGADVADDAGTALAVADMNGDGVADLLIGADDAAGPGNARPNAGEIYLILGRASLGGIVDLAAGGPSATVYGAESGDDIGTALAVGDIDGDGRLDLVIGADDAAGPGNARPDGGEVHVLSGTALSGTVDLASSVRRLTILGAEPTDNFGTRVAIGDVNNDGLVDVVASADIASGPENSRGEAGEAYVVFGRASLSGTVDIADGGQDVTILGADLIDRLGGALAVGDVTGDGVADIVISSDDGDGPTNERFNAGEVYVIAGSPGLSGTVDILTGGQGLTIFGADVGDDLGRSMTVGNVLGDGVLEIVVSASKADGEANARSEAGEVYVINLGGEAGPGDAPNGNANHSPGGQTAAPGSIYASLGSGPSAGSGNAGLPWTTLIALLTMGGILLGAGAAAQIRLRAGHR